MIYLLIATLFNVGAFVAMKFTEGFSKPVPSILTVALYFIGVVLFAVAAKRVDVSMIYVVSFGLGTMLISLIGWTFFGENLNPSKLVAMALILGGAISLTTMG